MCQIYFNHTYLSTPHCTSSTKAPAMAEVGKYANIDEDCNIHVLMEQLLRYSACKFQNKAKGYGNNHWRFERLSTNFFLQKCHPSQYDPMRFASCCICSYQFMITDFGNIGAHAKRCFLYAQCTVVWKNYQLAHNSQRFPISIWCVQVEGKGCQIVFIDFWTRLV